MVVRKATKSSAPLLPPNDQRQTTNDGFPHGTFFDSPTYHQQEMVMRARLASIPFGVWALIGLPVLVVTRCVVMTIVPQIVHAVVPQVVVTVLRVI
jgi:hypothetical protein